MHYESKDLKLLDDRVTDRLGTITLADIPDPQPRCPARLEGTTPILERLWRVALDDAESNIRETELGKYFAGGAKFGAIVFTRDISYSGILGLNRFYPDIMRSGLDVTRRVHWDTGFAVTPGHAVPAIDVPWEETGLDNTAFKDRYHTNCYSRRTDDVIWLWAARDLFSLGTTSREDWTWLYDWGMKFFERFYRPFFDPVDGLYRGQVSFVDVTWPERGRATSGYPAHYTVEDCLMIKASSTNALYLKGLRVMAEAAETIGRKDEARNWTERAEKLKGAIQNNLVAKNGRIACYKDRHGDLSPHSDALGTALCILHDAVDKLTGAESARRYPKTPIGIPLFDPFWPNDLMYHNNSSWPFVDALFLWAAEKVLGESQAAYNLALLARVVKPDGFHELVNIRSGAVIGSCHQLWSAAAFINASRRAGLTIRGRST
ncbi:MAG: hypothetical protein WC299_00100 [Kiritimatiellia bacterium]